MVAAMAGATLIESISTEISSATAIRLLFNITVPPIPFIYPSIPLHLTLPPVNHPSWAGYAGGVFLSTGIPPSLLVDVAQTKLSAKEIATSS